MSFTLGVDIGTDRSRGVLADPHGEMIARAERPHKMLVPRPGWADHRAQADWWRGFTTIAQEIIAAGGADPHVIKAVAVSGIGPCMLPLDVAGAPLMNAVLYGVDNRAAEVAELTARIGEDVLIARCGNPLSAQSVGPKVLWLRRSHSTSSPRRRRSRRPQATWCSGSPANT